MYARNRMFSKLFYLWLEKGKFDIDCEGINWPMNYDAIYFVIFSPNVWFSNNFLLNNWANLRNRIFSKLFYLSLEKRTFDIDCAGINWPLSYLAIFFCHFEHKVSGFQKCFFSITGPIAQCHLRQTLYSVPITAPTWHVNNCLQFFFWVS